MESSGLFSFSSYSVVNTPWVYALFSIAVTVEYELVPWMWIAGHEKMAWYNIYKVFCYSNVELFKSKYH